MKSKLLLILLLIVAMLLVACGGGETAPADTGGEEADTGETADTGEEAEVEEVEEAPPASDEVVEVIWYVRSEESEQGWETDVVIPDFEAKNPNIKVNLVVVPWDESSDTKMQAMIAAGTPPDVWSHWGPSGFADYVQRGLVADLTPYIEQDNFDLADFIPEVLDIYTVDGKVMGFPMLTTGSFIFYNKDLFDAAGVEYPPSDWDDTSWTWDAFVEMCGEMTTNTDDPEMAVYGCNLGFWPNDQYAWMGGQDLYPPEAYETGFASESYLDSQAAIDAFQARQDMIWKDGYMPDPATADALGAGGGLFEGQKVAMELTGGWGWWNFTGLEDEFNWGAAALPYTEGRKAVVFTDPWMMSAESPHPEEAWEFMKYLASPEAQQQWMELTGAPPVRQSLAEGWYGQFPSMTPEEVKENHLGALKHGQESPNHLLVRFDQLNQVVGACLDPINNNEAMAADVLPDCNAELTATLQQIQDEYK